MWVRYAGTNERHDKDQYCPRNIILHIKVPYTVIVTNIYWKIHKAVCCSTSPNKLTAGLIPSKCNIDIDWYTFHPQPPREITYQLQRSSLVFPLGV